MRIRNSAEFARSLSLPADPAHQPALVVKDLKKGATDDHIAQLFAPTHRGSGAFDESRAIRVAEADDFPQHESAFGAELEIVPVDGLVDWGDFVVPERRSVSQGFRVRGEYGIARCGRWKVVDRPALVHSLGPIRKEHRRRHPLPSADFPLRAARLRFHDPVGRLLGRGRGVLVTAGEDDRGQQRGGHQPDPRVLQTHTTFPAGGFAVILPTTLSSGNLIPSTDGGLSDWLQSSLPLHACSVPPRDRHTSGRLPGGDTPAHGIRFLAQYTAAGAPKDGSRLSSMLSFRSPRSLRRAPGPLARHPFGFGRDPHRHG